MRGPKNPEQVKRQIERWGVLYIGTREALIAAGHVRADAAFPGPQTDRHAPRPRHEATDRSGHKVSIRRNGARRFEILCKREHSELEAAEWKRIEAARAAWWAEYHAKREREEAEQQEKSDRDYRERRRAENRSKYATADEFRRGQAEIAEALPQAVITNMSSGAYGWRLCDEDRDRLLGLKAALVAAIQNARVVRDGEEEKPRLRLVKA